jgi:hypothetical protein
MRPRAKEVIPLENKMLLVTFDNGENKLFDVNPYLEFEIFEDLKEESIFRTVHIAGLSIEWINGQDICPDELYFNSVNIESAHEYKQLKLI